MHVLHERYRIVPLDMTFSCSFPPVRITFTEIPTIRLRLMSHDFKLVLDYPHESGDRGAGHGMQWSRLSKFSQNTENLHKFR